MAQDQDCDGRGLADNLERGPAGFDGSDARVRRRRAAELQRAQGLKAGAFADQGLHPGVGDLHVPEHQRGQRLEAGLGAAM